MTSPEISPAPDAGSFGSRLLFGVLGLLALGIGAVITLGAALAGAIAIAVAGYVMSRQGKRLTRRGAWFASVFGTMAVVLVLMGIAVATDDSTAKPMTAAERAEQRARAQEAMPDWLKQINPNAGQRTAAADSVAEKLLQNRTVVLWAGIMGAVIGSSMIGLIAGSFAWGGVILLYRGVRGGWLGRDGTASHDVPASQPI
jgi:predicted PurR-regulated permease PerM